MNTKTAVLVGLTMLLSSCGLVLRSAPSLWERVDAQTLVFSGGIDSRTDEAFLEAVTPETTKLIVNTTGGDVESALIVADYIFKHQLDLEVREVCGSSCANYWFTAAKKKTVPRGAYVGFHGDVGSSLPYWGTVTDEVMTYTQKVIAKEAAFYKRIKLDSRIFAFSAAFAVHHKTIWAASPAELACVGVKNLEMWFSDNPNDFTAANRLWQPTVKTSAQDTRVPRPSLCQPQN